MLSWHRSNRAHLYEVFISAVKLWHLLFAVTHCVLGQFFWSLHVSVGRTKCKHPWIQWALRIWLYSEGQQGEARRWVRKNCLAPDSHCPVELLLCHTGLQSWDLRIPPTLFLLSIWVFSKKPLSPISSIKIWSKGLVSFLYIFLYFALWIFAF